MSLKNVISSLESISAELAEASESREYLIRNTRGATILCSRAIISVHKGDIASAKQMASDAKSQIKGYRQKASGGLDRHLAVPEQELVEAMALIAISEGKPIPSSRSCGVSGAAYVLGLLDCIGELKRLVYDKIRTGRTKEAARVFGIMEELYEHLYPLVIWDKVLKEARKKLDVDRILVEGTRAALTEEIRRQELLDAIDRIG